MVYFDVTDVVHHATRYSRVSGIQRVQMNIISLLAQQHRGAIRCVFYDHSRQAMFEFDPSLRPIEVEFDAVGFLFDLGLTRGSSRFPSQVQLKSYLRRYNNHKLLRIVKKLQIYFTAIASPQRLKSMGLNNDNTAGTTRSALVVSTLSSLPDKSHYICMGSVWLYPAIWKFAQDHHAKGGDVVQMIHDLIPISHPQYLPQREPAAFETWLRSTLRYTSRFISNSQWTARDLQRFAAVIGVQPTIRPVALAQEFMGFERRATLALPPSLAWLQDVTYVLCLGTIEYRKNGVALLQAWEQLACELGVEKMPLLIFAGRYGKGGAEVEKRIRNSKLLEKFVRIVHAPSDREVASLYGNCLFTAFPSLIEGWGLPVGEAAWFGKLCVASKATAIPEVCGELMDYVDPTNSADIALGLKRPILDRDYLAQRELRIAAAKLRRWSNVANEIYEFVTSGSDNVTKLAS